MIKILVKDLVLSSGRILKKGTKVTDEKNSEYIQFTTAKMNELDVNGFFKLKKVINNLNSN